MNSTNITTNTTNNIMSNFTASTISEQEINDHLYFYSNLILVVAFCQYFYLFVKNVKEYLINKSKLGYTSLLTDDKPDDDNN